MYSWKFVQLDFHLYMFRNFTLHPRCFFLRLIISFSKVFGDIDTHRYTTTHTRHINTSDMQHSPFSLTQTTHICAGVSVGVAYQ